MLVKLTGIVCNFFSKVKNRLISKRNYLLAFVIFMLLQYDVKLINRLKNSQPIIDYSTNLCFLPTWRDDLNNSDVSCFGNCCLTSAFNIDSDLNCIFSCKPSLFDHYRSSNIFFIFLPIRIFPRKDKKVISFSLYGLDKRYLRNAIKVIRAYKKLLQDWIPRFYVGSDVPPLMVNRLIYEGAEVIMVYQNQPSNSVNGPKPPSYHGMFWRFFVSQDINVKRYLVRDADSIPIQREIDAINQWIDEKTMFHVMRDNAEHSTEILGGMWGGIVNLKSFNLSQTYEAAISDGFNVFDGKGVDQYFLRSYLWPIVQSNMTCHVSYHWFFISDRGCKDFPTKRTGNEFVGDAILY
ncbi:uncharacterized protein LOC107372178 [Tetranychus urticae]|nr:uncharacterized protein LOC107372178 [Tetranychus urticae]